MKTINVSKLTQDQLSNYLAISAEHNDGLAEFWLECGAKLENNECVIKYAIENDDENLVDLLLNLKDVNVNALVDGVPVWFYSLCNIKYFNKFKKFNLNIHNGSCRQTTVLEMAYYFDNKEVVDVLIEMGADVNEVTSTGMTLIANIINYNYGDTDVECFDKLIKAGADINKTLINPFKEFVVYWAIRNRGLNDEIANKALEAGINLNFVKPSILTQFRDYETLKKLIHYGADVNGEDSCGNKILIYHLRSIPLNNKVVELLLENGADPSVVDYNGITVMKYAKIYGDKETVKLIKKYLNK